MKNENLQRSFLLCISLFMTSFILAPASYGLEAHVEYGLDSNPHKISSSPYSAEYRELRVEHSGKRRLDNNSSIRYTAKVRDRQYGSVSSAADTFQFDARLRWANLFNIGEKTANFMITADFRNEKKTYFHQLQRQIAIASSGDSLADRFNYNAGKLSGELIYRFDKLKSLSLYAYFSRRNYLEDYQHIDIESLDFTEYSLQPNFRYRSESGLKARAFVYLRYRHYDQLLNDNSEGRNMDGSFVVYQLLGCGVVVSKPLTERLTARLYVNGYQARDNGDGYRDLDYHKLDLNLTYDTGRDATLGLNAIVYSKDYLADSARVLDLDTGDAGRKRTGWKLEVVYKRPLMEISSKPLYWLIKAVALKEDNSEDVLSYKADTFSLGLSYQFQDCC